uniref:Ribosomal protein S14 n=1 Tax=Euplotes vanleeuwenhoeki TaxID=2794224 RepID=A0A7T1C563_9SPIT|nr:hypothetical protein KQ443_mgp17 [Euplotes vanleeuwenhoeki]QPM99261.1 hypothetical protein MitoLV_33 [Euplotes vanleeuwenhoeki]
MKRKFIFLKFLKFKILNLIILNLNISYILKQKALYYFSKYYYKSSSTHSYKICALSARSYAISKHYLLSRFLYNRLLKDGILNGIKIHSW